jgi:metallophosphoesterase superfamily enzyme
VHRHEWAQPCSQIELGLLHVGHHHPAATTRQRYYCGRARFNARSARATITAAAVDHPSLVDEATFREVAGQAA